MTKIVLYFQAATLRSKSWRDKIAGIYKYAEKAHWQVQLVQSGVSADEIKYMLKTWQPIGCIVDRSLSDARNPTTLFKTIPVVLMEQNPETASGSYSNVSHDSTASAVIAAEELRKTGVRYLSYVPHRLNTYWNRAREKAIVESARKFGLQFVKWVRPPRPLSRSSAQQDETIARNLESLPKPCGILCANDLIAQQIVRVAEKSGIAIPKDLTLVGIDNDEMICENSSPTISSILPDFQGGGYLAAELLERRIRDPHAEIVTVKYGPLQFIRRQTTSRHTHKDPLVNRALDIISRRAFDPDFHTQEILTELHISRSLLEMRFRRELGHTIRETIQDLRFERALSYLRNPNQAITPIPTLCGYASEPFFKRMFKNRTGLTMREWRKRNVLSRA